VTAIGNKRTISQTTVLV